METVNSATVNMKIKELTNLLKVTKIPAHRKRIEVDLKSYSTVKKLLDDSK